MAIRPFLAMTAAEIRESTQLPPKIGWMACHFSPYGRGLSNLPHTVPENTLLIVDDITPIRGHDPEYITQQLLQCSAALSFSPILLDFQRPGNPETTELIKYLSKALPCPPAVSQTYAADIKTCPVVADPLPLTVPLQEHISLWSDREIWLDLSRQGEVIQLSETGSSVRALSPWENPEGGFSEDTLHCHYRAELANTYAVFTLWRTKEDLSTLLEEAEGLGVTHAVGLYQELHPFFA